MPPQPQVQPAVLSPVPIDPSGQIPPTELPKKRMSIWRKIAIVVGVLLLINAASGIMLWLHNRSHPTTAPATNDSLVTTLNKPSLTAADVAKINKADAFYAYLKHAAEQQKLITTRAYFVDGDSAAQAENIFSKTGYDYATGKLVYAYESTNVSGGRDRIRCYDGQEYMNIAVLGTWDKESGPSDCGQDKLYSSVSDGFDASGLSSSQAEKFVTYLRAPKPSGVIEVKNLQLVARAGKQYLHFTAELQPHKADGVYMGAQWLMWAFKSTGLNPTSHPFDYVGTAEEGITLEYYIDPTTGLPAYSELTPIAPKDDSGKTTSFSDLYHYRVQYDYTTGMFDASSNNNADITINW